MEAPNGSGEAQREQYCSYDAHIPAAAHVFLSFARKKEVQEPRKQHPQAH